MRKFENVDIINSLRRIMNINTEHYKKDFLLDVDTIHTAALSDNAKDKDLLFMSRLNGTYCYCETDVFTKDTSAYNTWTYYGEQTHDNIIAYAIKITGFENEVIKGNLYELDYPKHFKHVINVSVCADSVSADEELKFTLSCEHKRLEKLKCGNIDNHIADLSKKKIKAKLDKMTEAEKEDTVYDIFDMLAVQFQKFGFYRFRVSFLACNSQVFSCGTYRFSDNINNFIQHTDIAV